MKRLWILTLAWIFAVLTLHAKTLVVYYSFTNNVHTVVADLLTQIDADGLRIEPAEKGLDYAANNYAIGSRLIQAIRDNPDDAASYPAIDPVEVNFSDYDLIVIAAPLWWNNMAAPMQSFLFASGEQMAGKKIALIVSSASSVINGVVADAKRLVPHGDFVEPNLWIRSSQISNCHSLTAQWLVDIGYDNLVASLSSPCVNPAANRITLDDTGVEVTGPFESLSLFNTEGKLMLQTSLAFTPCRLQTGCYLAKLREDGNVYTAKLFKK